jgi:hypothetical protein
MATLLVAWALRVAQPQKQLEQLGLNFLFDWEGLQLYYHYKP